MPAHDLVQVSNLQGTAYDLDLTHLRGFPPINFLTSNRQLKVPVYLALGCQSLLQPTQTPPLPRPSWAWADTDTLTPPSWALFV